MAPHFSTLAWKIPQMEEPGGPQSMGSLTVKHDWATSLSLFTFMHWRRKWQPTPVFLPGESQGRGAWWAAAYGVAQSRTQLKRLSSSSSRGPMQKTKCFPKSNVRLQMNLFTKQKEIHRLREWTYGCQRRRTEGRDRSGVWDWQAHTDRCKRDDQQGPTVKKKKEEINKIILKKKKKRRASIPFCLFYWFFMIPSWCLVIEFPKNALCMVLSSGNPD